MRIAKSKLGLAAAVVLGLTTPILAMTLPRGTLWRVEQTCVLNQRTTGSPFPCLKVDFAQGVALLRAPFRQTHLVTMPLARITGVEDPQLREPGPNYFQLAWDAKPFLQSELDRPLAWNDVGLAVNSRYTRSQDQLHIHLDCVRAEVRSAIAAALPDIPVGRWKSDVYRFYSQTYWGRRIDATTLQGIRVFNLIDELPALREHPPRAVVAVLGVSDPVHGDGFVLLAGESNPRYGNGQSTSEDLLDHKCRT